MNFLDIPVGDLPANGTYYFNVLLINIPVVDLEYEEYWNIEKVCGPRPMAYHLFRVGEEEEIMIELEPDAVIEVRENKINWYRMYDEDENFVF